MGWGGGAVSSDSPRGAGAGKAGRSRDEAAPRQGPAADSLGTGVARAYTHPPSPHPRVVCRQRRCRGPGGGVISLRRCSKDTGGLAPGHRVHTLRRRGGDLGGRQRHRPGRPLAGRRAAGTPARRLRDPPADATRRVICSPGSPSACWPRACRRRSRRPCSSCRRRASPGPPRCSCSTGPCSSRQLQGHSPEGYKFLSLLASAEGRRGCLGSCRPTGSAPRGRGTRPGSSWSTCSILC